MKRVLLVTAVLCVLVSAAMIAGPIDSFISLYQTGNIHEVIDMHPVDVIRIFGAEPFSYSSYGSDQRIFTYVDPDARQGIVSVAFIWSGSSVDEIRLMFDGEVFPLAVFAMLGYRVNFFNAQERQTKRLGNVPYYVTVFTNSYLYPAWPGASFFLNLHFAFLLNHLSESVHVLIIERERFHL